MTILHESQILGNIIMYSMYLFANDICIEKSEHYQKRSPRNRYDILTSQGVKTLSIPLCRGKNQQMPVSDVKISYDENWIKNHLETIKSAYGKSPFFEFYFPVVEHIFNKRHTFLYDLNLELLISMLKSLKMTIQIQETEIFLPNYPNDNEFLDFRNQTYHFDKVIASHLPAYPQVWQSHTGFTPSLSILDLLLCLGPEAPSYLYDIQPFIRQKLSEKHPSLQLSQA